MPDSLRDLLRRRATEAGGASGDLTEGALMKARAIGRRRFAAAAAGAVVGIALAGLAAGALVLPDDNSPAPPADETTTPTEEPSDSPTDEETTPTDESSEDASDCGRPSGDWTGWGDSASVSTLTELPQTLFMEVRQDGAGPEPQIVRYDGEQDDTVLGPGSYFLAPDGNRYVAEALCGSSIATIDGSGAEVGDLGIEAQFCDPVWSPDSNLLVVGVPSPEYDEQYLLDVATGAQSELPDEVACAPRWSGDGEYLVSGDGRVAIRPDGSDRVDLTGASAWTEDEEFSGMSSISADLERACLQLDDAEYAGSGHIDPRRCDRYVDTATGETLELPVETEIAQVVFLADGSMIVTDDRYGEIVVSLIDADGTVADQRTLPGLGSGGTYLVGYYTG